MSKHKITLDNFTDWHGEVNGIELESYLPLPDYVPTNELEVNLGRIARLAQVGRLASVQFGLYSEECSGTFGVRSINSDGSSTAAAVKTSSPARAKSEADSPFQNEQYIFPPGHGLVKVNVSHPDLDDQVLREAKPWARLLQRGMSDGIYHAGKKQMTSYRDIRYKAAGMLWGGYSAIGGGVALLTQDINTLVIVPVCSSAHGVIYPQIDKVTGKQQLAETSLLPFWPQDRILALRLLSKTQSIVTVK